MTMDHVRAMALALLAISSPAVSAQDSATERPAAAADGAEIAEPSPVAGDGPSATAGDADRAAQRNDPPEAQSSAAQNDDTVTASTARLQLDTTQVTGNRELPKVLVIVPWKNPDLVELTGRPLASLVEEVLAPIDPAVFKRQVEFYNDLNDSEN